MKFNLVLNLVLCASAGFAYGLTEEELEIKESCCSHGESVDVESAGSCGAVEPPDYIEPDQIVLCSAAITSCCEKQFKSKQACEAGMKLAVTKRCSTPVTEIGQTCCNECTYGRWTGEAQGKDGCGSPPGDDYLPHTKLKKNAYYQCCLEAAETLETTTEKKPETTTPVTTTPVATTPVTTTPVTTTPKATTTTEKPKCKNNSCEHLCDDEGGLIRCSCRQGYRLQSDKTSCKDINECAESLDDLCTAEGTVCHNTPGSFKCVPLGSPPPKRDVGSSCPPGFKMNVANQVCDDINECQLSRPPCPKYLCENTIGGYKCAGKAGKPYADALPGAPTTEAMVTSSVPPKNDICPPGFRAGPDDECLDIDECEERLDDCQRLSQHCINTHGSFFCQDHVSKRCAPGFKVNARTGICEDIDECEESSELCRRTEVCVNLPGAYNCKSKISTLPKLASKTCQEGTRLRPGGTICEDIDECREGTHLCDQFQNCINTFGAHECRCKNGFELDSSSGSCVDIDECALKLDNCGPGQRCLNMLGSFTCARGNPTTTTSTHKPEDYEYYDSYEEVETDVPESPLQPTVPTTTQRPTTTPRRPITTTKKPTTTTERPTTTTQRPTTTTERPTTTTEKRTTTSTARPTTTSRKPTTSTELARTNKPPTENQPDPSVPSYPDHGSEYPSRPSYPSYPSPGFRPPYSRPAYPGRPSYPRPEYPRPNYPGYDNYPDGDNSRRPYPSRPETTVPRPVYPRPGYPESITTTSTTPAPITTEEDRRTNEVDDTFNPDEVHCFEGYEKDADGNCVEENICETDRHTCKSQEVCVKKPGGYDCECMTGFHRDRSGWCAPTPTRPTTVVTTSTVQTPTVTPTHWYTPVYPTRRQPAPPCELGYTYDARQSKCVDIDECATNRASCSPEEKCVNIDGGFRCDEEDTPTYSITTSTARPTPPSDGRNVITVGAQYGQRGPYSPRPTYTRVPNVGAVIASCPWGYKLTPDKRCYDIDECARNSSECGPQQRCENFYGGYSCQCPNGHRLVGQNQCDDINECMHGNPCAFNAQCVNTWGSYKCMCRDGFRSAPTNDKVCVDIDECTETPGVCQQLCSNTWGHYRCYCKRGFRLDEDNRTCVDINECEQYGRGKLCSGQCINEPGSYRCSCPKGYRMSEDSRSCVDIDECETGIASCNGEGAVCQNTRGSYHCHHIQCPAGYHLESKHRCSRVQRSCQVGDWNCLQQPSTYSYNFITFVANIYLPSGSVDLFTMHGPSWVESVVSFEMRLVDVQAMPGVRPADLRCFDMRPSNNICVISLLCSLEGPQVVELELTMSLYQRATFAGTAVARLIVIVSEYEF